ncbi:hypothetical protein ZPAH1_orf00345 [Aeromonas phage ZPAH1]|nr:hypothetical protein ASwh1_299 [Aeromonas phage Aswh_1]QQG34107.1 hypothetical protein ZPAH1_orf00345 [Aeromonas phage ZPAH1]
MNINPVAKHNFNRPSVMSDKKKETNRVRGKKHKNKNERDW